MSYFDDVQGNMKVQKVLIKFKHFDRMYYNLKKILASDEFKNTGSGSVRNVDLDIHSFKRTIKTKNATVYVNSGLICTTISLQPEYYTSVQCSMIVTRSKHKSTSSSDDTNTRRRSSGMSLSKDDSSTNSFGIDRSGWYL